MPFHVEDQNNIPNTVYLNSCFGGGTTQTMGYRHIRKVSIWFETLSNVTSIALAQFYPNSSYVMSPESVANLQDRIPEAPDFDRKKLTVFGVYDTKDSI